MRKNVQMVNVVRGLKAQWQTDRASDRDRRKGRRAAREKDRQQGSRCHSGFIPRCTHLPLSLGVEMPPKRNFARLDAFTRGQIWGMKLGGMPREEMLEHVWKKDGTELTLHTLDDVIKKKTD